MIGAGIIPGGMEMMDRPAIHAAEDFLHAGYPLDVEALLIIELDGPEPEVEHLIGVVESIARNAGAITVQASRNEGAAEVLGRLQGRLPRRRPAQPRLPLHGRHHPSAQVRRCAGPRPSCRRASCAAATSFMPATAICTADLLRRRHTPGDLEKVECIRRRHSCAPACGSAAC